MMRVIQDYDSNEDALAVHVDAMVEAALVAEQNHGYPSKLTEPSLMVGNTLKNWANTLDIYDYLQSWFLSRFSSITALILPRSYRPRPRDEGLGFVSFNPLCTTDF